MLQRILAGYQRIAKWLDRTPSLRRSAALGVFALEERATPAVALNFEPPIAPPALVQTVAPPTQIARPIVHAELFGVGAASRPEHANELDEMLTSEQAARRDAECEPAARHEENLDADDSAAVIIEDMMFVARAS